MKNIPKLLPGISVFFTLSFLQLSTPGSSQQVCTDSMHIYGLSAGQPYFGPGYFLTGLSNGNYIYSAGRSDTTTLVLTDANGAFLNAKRLHLPSGGLGTLLKIVSAPDGGLMLTGFVSTIGFYGVFIVKLDAQLNIVWAKKLRGVQERDFIALTRDFDFYCDRDGVSYIVFHSYHYLDRYEDGAMVSIDGQGTLRWSRSFIFSGLGNFPDMINALAVSGNRVCFFGRGLDGNRPSVAAFAFEKDNGNFLGGKRIVIEDETVDLVGADQAPSYSGSLAVNDNGFFYVVEGKNDFPRRGHLYQLSLDSLFNPGPVRKIKNFAMSAGDVKQIAVSKEGLLAFSGGSMDPIAGNDCLGIVDGQGQIVISKKTSRGFFNAPNTITKLLFGQGNRLHVGFGAYPAQDSLVQMDMPLYADSLQYGCLAKDTAFFGVESLTARQFPILTITSFIPGLLTTTDLSVTAADFLMYKVEHCKVKSICTAVLLTGNSSFCPGTPQVYRVSKNEDCFKKIKWNT
ncbi:MAG TPA: hypothetical protein VGO58_20400, partial [Chitinophagaceae bacterium]|nr:hypothetical protein [Chitinophagaceae bacterium]